MNIGQVLKNSYNLLSSASQTYKLDIEILLAHVLKKKNRLDLFLNTEEELNNEERGKFEDFINQRISKKPISKIINQKSFWNFDLDVSKKVLIPRPETEVLIEMVTKEINKKKKLKFLDIGCGSGCISISLLEHYKKSVGTGIDISKDAILNTKTNLNNYNFTNRIKLLRENIFTYKTDKKFDLIISNPPYLKLSDYINLDPGIKKYEPKEALIGDNKEGLRFYKEIIKKFKNNIKLNGYFAFEIGDNQFMQINKLLILNGFIVVSKYKLINNQIRCLLAKKVKN
ncbi:peptide chain release factor N(5)-glutamine methyltransferase [Candidatus Pelagibacter sp. HIMB1517]|uniref:peptide chain release factor N(5)-glutamine methyltransferase n=1 Tax=Candidatus Pelagibacter sp. HIMB1517 TaxID=3413341 RepID=UPI003F84D81C